MQAEISGQRRGNMLRDSWDMGRERGTHRLVRALHTVLESMYVDTVCARWQRSGCQGRSVSFGSRQLGDKELIGDLFCTGR